MTQFPDLHDRIPVGVVVPPSNPVVEPELAALLGSAVVCYGNRLPRFADFDLKQRNRLYVRSYPEALDSLAGLSLQATLIAMTGPQYAYGVAGDRQLCDDLSARFGAPVATASMAIHDALTAMGHTTIRLLSPYPQWLTERAAAYWSDAGFEVADVHQDFITGEAFRAYETTSEEVTEVLRTLPTGPPVVLTGTGLATLRSLHLAGQQTPVLSSNLCGAWWLLRQLGLPGSDLFRSVAQALPI